MDERKDGGDMVTIKGHIEFGMKKTGSASF